SAARCWGAFEHLATDRTISPKQGQPNERLRRTQWEKLMNRTFGRLLFASAFAAGPAFAQDPGITDTSIKLGTQAPMSGPVAMIGMVAEGQKLKFDAINAAGGVKMGDGKTRKVELVIMDDANEPPRTVTNARRMAEQ